MKSVTEVSMLEKIKQFLLFLIIRTDIKAEMSRTKMMNQSLGERVVPKIGH